MDAFDLQGTRYYQQYRNCNKPTCRSCVDGPGHGPYWFSRKKQGKVTYIGKELPEKITAARFSHDSLIPEIMATRLVLVKQVHALNKLIKNKPLTLEDRAIITELGFGNALAENAQEPELPLIKVIEEKGILEQEELLWTSGSIRAESYGLKVDLELITVIFCMKSP